MNIIVRAATVLVLGGMLVATGCGLQSASGHVGGVSVATSR